MAFIVWVSEQLPHHCCTCVTSARLYLSFAKLLNRMFSSSICFSSYITRIHCGTALMFLQIQTLEWVSVFSWAGEYRIILQTPWQISLEFSWKLFHCSKNFIKDTIIQQHFIKLYKILVFYIMLIELILPEFLSIVYFVSSWVSMYSFI